MGQRLRVANNSGGGSTLLRMTRNAARHSITKHITPLLLFIRRSDVSLSNTHQPMSRSLWISSNSFQMSSSSKSTLTSSPMTWPAHLVCPAASTTSPHHSSILSQGWIPPTQTRLSSLSLSVHWSRQAQSLGFHVRNLRIQWDSEETTPYDNDQPHFYSAAERFGLSVPRITESAQVILLLHLLPHLRTLNLFPPEHCFEYNFLIECLLTLQKISTLPPAFLSLRVYDCFWDRNGTCLSNRALLSLLRLPQIQSIKVPARYGFNLTPRETRIAAKTSSTVTRLKFTSARIRPADLLAILKTPRALSHFSLYHRSIRIDYDFHALRSALDPLRQSLTKLVLSYWTTNALALRHRTRSKPIGSLRDWPVLQSVTCSLLPILGQGRPGESRDIAEVMPECIRELEILDDQFWTLDDALYEAAVMVRRKRAMLPELRRLTVYSRTRGAEEARERLRCECAEAGVQGVDYVYVD